MPLAARRWLSAVAVMLLVLAGGSASAAAIDTTPPTIEMVFPKNGQHVEQYSELKPEVRCEDEPGGSGVARCGRPTGLDTVRLGEHSYLVLAADVAGNETEARFSYFVDAPDETPGHLSDLRPVVQNGIVRLWFRLDHKSDVQVSTFQIRGGVLRGRRCVKPGRTSARGRRCDLQLGPPAYEWALPARKGFVWFPGRFEPGRYRLTLEVILNWHGAWSRTRAEIGSRASVDIRVPPSAKSPRAKTAAAPVCRIWPGTPRAAESVDFPGRRATVLWGDFRCRRAVRLAWMVSGHVLAQRIVYFPDFTYRVAIEDTCTRRRHPQRKVWTSMALLGPHDRVLVRGESRKVLPPC
ncbi:hypothetical protein [Conexibacter sp. CPCC 206217]|uniref:hypothetical protein n=1 Tax=Conexibacter sp. CPCC 206217 TaxID=3064574 RepID=UPI00272631B0|nr:hypothetical protein [Conexibacter sp. CPCC 206217]MDO8213465.1 hypothetical protein [Conexibacter sp. CPCC 206217]